LKSLFLLLLLITFGSTAILTAQQLQGVITDFEGNETLVAVTVMNKTKSQTVVSDADGKYNIAAQKGDEIEFTYVGYYSLTILMPEDGVVFRRVSLKKKLFSLEEVVIGPSWTPYQKDSIARRKTYALDLSRQKVSSSALASVFSPATALAEQFSKKSKQRFRFQSNYAKWEDQKFVDTRYTNEEVTALTGLQGDTLAAFINAHPMPTDYARTATDLEIKMWIKYNYREWIKKPIVLPKVIPNNLSDTLKVE